MWKCCGVLCCVIVAIACRSPVSASPAGRTLTSAESWSVHGGDIMCSTGWGRCYTNPMDCSQYNGDQNCNTYSVLSSLSNSVTCQPSTNENDVCTEVGLQLKCIQSTPCWELTIMGQLNCVNDDDNAAASGNTTGPAEGVYGDQC